MHCVVLVTFAREEKKKNLCLFAHSKFTFRLACQRLYFTGIMDEEMVKRKHFSRVLIDSLNNGTVYFIRNTFIVDKMK